MTSFPLLSLLVFPPAVSAAALLQFAAEGKRAIRWFALATAASITPRVIAFIRTNGVWPMVSRMLSQIFRPRGFDTSRSYPPLGTTPATGGW